MLQKKNFLANILAINYFDSQQNLFSALYQAEFLNTSVKPFFSLR